MFLVTSELLQENSNFSSLSCCKVQFCTVCAPSVVKVYPLKANHVQGDVVDACDGDDDSVQTS